jgi:hypothetical protein
LTAARALTLILCAAAASACAQVIGLDDSLPAAACEARLHSDPANCGACGRTCQGGACVDGRCAPMTLARDQAQPVALALDATRVFWVLEDGGLGWARKDGTQNGTLWQAPAGDSGRGIAIDGGNLYWHTSLAVRRAPAGGGDIAVDEVAQTVGYLRRCAVAGGTVYCSAGSCANDVESCVAWWPFGNPAGAVFTHNQPWADRVVVDEQYVYWTNNTSPGEVRRVRRDAQGLIQDLATDLDQPGPLAVAAGAVYWVDATWSLRRLAPDATVPTSLAGGLPGVSDLAVDASGAYLASSYDVSMVPPGGGDPQQLAAVRSSWSLALDDDAVYWVDHDAGTVMKVWK